MLFTGKSCGKGISLRDVDFTHRVFDHLINIAGGVSGRIPEGSIFILAEQIFQQNVFNNFKAQINKNNYEDGSNQRGVSISLHTFLVSCTCCSSCDIG